LRRLLVVLHVIAGVGLLGIDIAMLSLGWSGATAGDVTTARAAYTSMQSLISPFLPTMAISALVTGAILSVGTKWGLLRHYWIVAKIVVNIAVIVIGARVVKGLVQQALAATLGAASVPTPAAMLLVAASASNLTLLVFATTVSIYKPWGATRRGREAAAAGTSRRRPADRG